MAQPFQTSTDGIINGALTKAWQITLTSTNGALKFVNFDPGDLLTLVVVEDASGSNYTLTFPSSVVWQAGAAPNRNTNAAAVAVYTFSFDGTNFRDTGGSASKLPSKIAYAGLGSIIGAGVVALTLIASNGNGGHTGPASPDAAQFKNGSGASATLVSKVNASGSYLAGQSGSIAIGSPTLGTADAKVLLTPAGKVIAKNSMSGTSLILNGFPGSGQILCMKTTGAVGTCGANAAVAGKCSPCN